MQITIIETYECVKLISKGKYKVEVGFANIVIAVLKSQL